LLAIPGIKPGTGGAATDEIPAMVTSGTPDETVGGAGAAAAAGLVTGVTLTGSTGTAVLTPRLPISVDPSAIPVRLGPPSAATVGRDDAAKPPAPLPHMPDNPDVSTIADDVGCAGAIDAGAAAPSATPPPP